MEVGQLISLVVNARSLIDGVMLRYAASQLPDGARFAPVARTFSWTPGAGQVGAHTIRFTVDDGVLPEYRDIVITVSERTK